MLPCANQTTVWIDLVRVDAVKTTLGNAGCDRGRRARGIWWDGRVPSALHHGVAIFTLPPFQLNVTKLRLDEIIVPCLRNE